MTTRGHQTRVEAFKLIKIVRFFFMWVGSEWNRRNNTRAAFSRFEVYKYKRKWIGRGLHIREVIETFKALKPLVYLFWIFSGMMDWMEYRETDPRSRRKKGRNIAMCIYHWIRCCFTKIDQHNDFNDAILSIVHQRQYQWLKSNYLLLLLEISAWKSRFYCIFRLSKACRQRTTCHHDGHGH